MNGGYQIIDLTGIDLSRITVVDQVKNVTKPMLIHGLKVQGVLIPDFWYVYTTVNGTNLQGTIKYNGYNLMIDLPSGECVLANL